jgi:hypothetical protein
VAEHQKGFVASNMTSLAEAKADGVSNPLAIYAGGEMVELIIVRFAPPTTGPVFPVPASRRVPALTDTSEEPLVPKSRQEYNCRRRPGPTQA